MSSVPKPIYSEEEYLRLEEKSPEKHEFYRGEIFLMPGGSIRHNAISDNLVAALLRVLRGHGCRAFSSNQRVKVAAAGLTTYPDITIVCGPWEADELDAQALTNPKVLIEVLSPSTESYNRTEKFDLYKCLPSLQEYVLVAQDRPRIELFARQPDESWNLRTFIGLEATLNFASVEAAIPLAEIYQDIEFDPPLAN